MNTLVPLGPPAPRDFELILPAVINFGTNTDAESIVRSSKECPQTCRRLLEMLLEHTHLNLGVTRHRVFVEGALDLLVPLLHVFPVGNASDV